MYAFRVGYANALGLLAFPDRQAFCCVDAVHALVIDPRVLRAQYIVDPAIAPSPAGVGGLHNLLAQLHVERTCLALIAVSVAA